MSPLLPAETAYGRPPKRQGCIRLCRLRLWMGMGSVLLTGLAPPTHGADFQVQVYTWANPPPTAVLGELPLLSQITQDGITWTFSQPQRAGRFVNGDYYVVGPATVVDIQPLPTPTNGVDGSMLNIQPTGSKWPRPVSLAPFGG